MSFIVYLIVSLILSSFMATSLYYSGCIIILNMLFFDWFINTDKEYNTNFIYVIKKNINLSVNYDYDYGAGLGFIFKF